MCNIRGDLLDLMGQKYMCIFQSAKVKKLLIVAILFAHDKR